MTDGHSLDQLTQQLTGSSYLERILHAPHENLIIRGTESRRRLACCNWKLCGQLQVYSHLSYGADFWDSRAVNHTSAGA